jgi:hypothetical protein
VPCRTCKPPRRSPGAVRRGNSDISHRSYSLQSRLRIAEVRLVE